LVSRSCELPSPASRRSCVCSVAAGLPLGRQPRRSSGCLSRRPRLQMRRTVVVPNSRCSRRGSATSSATRSARVVTRVLGQKQDGGDGGIRTLDRALQPYNGLANRRLQPLGHISGRADMPDAGAGRKRQISGRPIPVPASVPSGRHRISPAQFLATTATTLVG
jgi:hypothetical protein